MDWKVHERSNEVFIGEVYDVFVMMYQYVWNPKMYIQYIYIYLLYDSKLYIYIYVYMCVKIQQ